MYACEVVCMTLFEMFTVAHNSTVRNFGVILRNVNVVEMYTDNKL